MSRNQARFRPESEIRFARRFGGDALEDIDDTWLPPRARRRQHAQRRPHRDWFDREEI